MKNNFNIGDLLIGGNNQVEGKETLFKLGYIYNIEKIKRKTRYFIRWEKNQHTPHYLPLEGTYTENDINTFIKNLYTYVPIK